MLVKVEAVIDAWTEDPAEAEFAVEEALWDTGFDFLELIVEELEKNEEEGGILTP